MIINTLAISPGTKDDLRKIYQYGIHKWVKTRASNYIDNLKTQFWSLTKHPQLGVERDELLSAMRSLSVESHVIFYRTNRQQIEIIRVLHGRQDPQRDVK